LAIGLVAGLLFNGTESPRTGIPAFVFTLCQPVDLQRLQSRHHPGAALLRRARQRQGLRQRHPHRADSLAGIAGGFGRRRHDLSALRQRLGRYILASRQPELGELSGIRSAAWSSPRTAFWDFFARLAGIMLVPACSSASRRFGEDWLILSFAAPVIGGAALAGGMSASSALCSASSSSPSSPRRW